MVLDGWFDLKLSFLGFTGSLSMLIQLIVDFIKSLKNFTYTLTTTYKDEATSQTTLLFVGAKATALRLVVANCYKRSQ